ncbi:uncharacterized protein [Chelonus insularis]|uniref:uncharacterized protein n=1 Tax=Chelonus insularis TaxID=460826 RepID=UPI0015884E55|nr:uncharacterized protein LOC118065319 [Chelonus insularis]
MLCRFIEIVEPISTVLLKFPKSPPMLSASEIEVSREIIAILKPMELATTEMCGQTYTTCSKVIPILCCLEKNLKAAYMTSPIAIQLRNDILDQLEIRFQNITKSYIHSVATVLDPRYKRVNFNKNCGDAALAFERVDKELKTFKKSVDDSNLGPKQVSTDHELWKFHVELVNNHNHDSENRFGSFGLSNCLKNYISQKIQPLNTDPIQYWAHEQNTPELSQIALKYLSIVATSAPCERLFSMAGNVQTRIRNRLTGEHLSNLLFLKSLDLSDWML